MSKKTKHSLKFKSVISAVLAVIMLAGTLPTMSVFAAQKSDYEDPADNWLKTNSRTNELDMNATVTYETQWCPVCNKHTTVMTYRVPEYTKSGQTALNHGVKWSDGYDLNGTVKGNTDSGTPGVDASYTGYHFTKSVCQNCGTINSVDGTGAYNFNNNVYGLNSCDHNFFIDFDNTTYEQYNSHQHTTILKKGEYCQFCKGTYAKATRQKETHNLDSVKDGVSEISLQRGYKTLKFNLKVSGPMTKAIESSDAAVIAAYIATQQTIADNLNSAIAENDRDGVYNFFFGTVGTGVFADIDAVSTDVLNNLPDTEKTEFASRMLTYEDGFTFTDIQSIYDFETTVLREAYVGKMNSLTTAENAKSALAAYNDYFELPLDGEWFTNTADNTLAGLLNTTYKNYSDLYNKFSAALILENLKQTINSEYMSKIIAGYADFIGYDKTHFKSVKTTAVAALINSKAAVSSIEDIKNFLDTYTAPAPAPTAAPGGSTGGGGGGSKNGGVSMAVNPSKNVPAENAETPVPAAERVQLYPDVPTDFWGYEAIRYLNAKKVISGYEDGTFRPENKITRAEFLTVLLWVFVPDEKETDKPVSEAKNVFKDADGDKWYYGTIDKAYREGLLHGDGENCFPEDNITRQEIAALIMRILTQNGAELDNSKNMSYFSDEDSIADWAAGSVTKLHAADIISGTNGMFMPLNNATRAEAAQIIYKAALAAGK